MSGKLQKLSVFASIYKDLMPVIMEVALESLLEEVDTLDVDSEEEVMKKSFSALSNSITRVETDVLESFAKLKSNPELMEKLRSAASKTTDGVLSSSDIESILGDIDGDDFGDAFGDMMEDDYDDKKLN